MLVCSAKLLSLFLWSLLWLQEVLGEEVDESSHRTYADPKLLSSWTDVDSLNYDLGTDVDGFTLGLDDNILQYFSKNVPDKRKPKFKLIPRIGRRKRSISENIDGKPDQNSIGIENDTSDADESGLMWDDLDEKRAAFIPRVGRSYFFSAGRGGPRLRYKQRGTFVPRVGRRKRSVSGNSDVNVDQSTTDVDQYMSDDEDKHLLWEDLDTKRASFIPRIGRSYAVSIGRGGPRLRYKMRGTFVPRVGRRKRSVSGNSDVNVDQSTTDVDQYMSDDEDKHLLWEDLDTKRASFIPRIGRSYSVSVGRGGPRLRHKLRGTFIPRVGRRKRSVSDNREGKAYLRSTENRQDTLSLDNDDFLWKYLQEKRAISIPIVERFHYYPTVTKYDNRLR